jgi:SAM-dependent methyltransferase
MVGPEYLPFEWCYQDAEQLAFESGSFDWCIEHNGLHHCQSPHRALLQMYRVARKGVLLFEPYDNLVTRAGRAFGLGQEYEHAAVYYNGMQYGGVRNTDIPNYVYRWTRQEIEKTIACNAPYGPHEFRWFHMMRIPWPQLRGRRNPVYVTAAIGALPILKLIELLAPQQSNCFAAAIFKPNLRTTTHPWLNSVESGLPVLNESWLEERYRSRGRGTRTPGH